MINIASLSQAQHNFSQFNYSTTKTKTKSLDEFKSGIN